MRLTHEEIEAARSPKGGWTKKQLAEWGVPWPPPKGWRRRLEGVPPRNVGKEYEIILKFDGVCMECGQDLYAGDSALWTVGGSARHPGPCPDVFNEFD